MSNKESNPVYGDDKEPEVKHEESVPVNPEGADGKLTDTPKNSEALQETAQPVFVFPKIVAGEGRSQKYLNTAIQCQTLVLAILKMLSGTERVESVVRWGVCVKAELTPSEIDKLKEQGLISNSILITEGGPELELLHSG